MKRILQTAVAAALPWIAGLVAAPAKAQDYPTAPVHVISGFPAGSAADITVALRLFAQKSFTVLAACANW